MYYTITLNPAIDMFTKAENFELGKLNRTGESDYVVGGKGINISLLLKNIGKESKALGFIAGFTGYFIKNELNKQGIESDFVETKGFTRINIKLTTDTETEINSQSSKVSAENIKEFFDTLEVLNSEDTVFLSGNIIPGMESDDFVKIAEKVKQKGAILFTSTGEVLGANIAKGKVVSTIAAGDSMLAMFVVKYDETKDFKLSLQYASAAGGATSFSAGVGKKELIDELLVQINVEEAL